MQKAKRGECPQEGGNKEKRIVGFGPKGTRDFSQGCIFGDGGEGRNGTYGTPRLVLEKKGGLWGQKGKGSE